MGSQGKFSPFMPPGTIGGRALFERIFFIVSHLIRNGSISWEIQGSITGHDGGMDGGN